ncbi:MAG: D-alanine--D-alanine ligase [Bacteroidia bacterium]
MSDKLKIGILFGGSSKEREISFAGGRTVYDNLNKSLFEVVPVFADSFGNFVLLNWEFVYKGSIRDFYPPVEFLPRGNEAYQLYAENLGKLGAKEQDALLDRIGTKIPASDLGLYMDFAFLCLHGAYGEDGRIQGLLEYLHIPYSGSGILPSALGMDKAIQKRFMTQAGFQSPNWFTVNRADWNKASSRQLFEKAGKEIGFPLVVKSAHQGSSIGISILNKASEDEFYNAVNKSFFIRDIDAGEWNNKALAEKTEWVRTLADIREGIGMPVRIGNLELFQPASLLEFLDKELAKDKSVCIESLDGETQVLLEGFIAGKEFSCIVIQDEQGNPIALPPTEIRKGKELFDYRSKYLPGLSRKITPIDLTDAGINKIRQACEKLFQALSFHVYARIDGFINEGGEVFLNDPNTTSGMMPSSFFFHQAAEIGLNPSQFLTYIIRTSLLERKRAGMNSGAYDNLCIRLDKLMQLDRSAATNRKKVAVVFGGYSSERHISVESGRNVYEKLASSVKYEPVPVFLTGNDQEHLLYQVPINVLLKDNADDIREKIEHYSIHPVVQEIINRCRFITELYSNAGLLVTPKRITYEELSQKVDIVFIALHGRPGEDGAIQEKLEVVGLPYNGSDKSSSEITIDKFRTNEILRKNGLLVAEHLLVSEEDWKQKKETIKATIAKKIGLPFIAKPVDDGCSSAVKKIKTLEELDAFAELIFRKTELLAAAAAAVLHIKPREEFPQKKTFLVEELISPKGALKFLEVTGGMLSHIANNGKQDYEVFEASEALSEGEVLSLEEKFLAGQGQNITPARYAVDKAEQAAISAQVKEQLGKAAALLGVKGYCRIDAFVRIFDKARAEVIFIEVNSLPGMTPATCIFHQAALNHYKPYEFIDQILEAGLIKKRVRAEKQSGS